MNCDLRISGMVPTFAFTSANREGVFALFVSCFILIPPSYGLQNLTQEVLCTTVLGVLENFVGRTLLDNHSVGHKQNPVGSLTYKSHFMADNNHCHTFCGYSS